MTSHSEILDLAQQRVLVLDGAMGTSAHDLDLPLSAYDGHENCVDYLVFSAPDAVREIHRSFLAVGCDAVSTNTFGANKIVYAEFGLEDRVRESNRLAGEIAREACHEFQRPSRPRFVIGSIGPGTRLPTLGQTDWDTIYDSYLAQMHGLLEGGVDALLIETCQDILQAKSAVVAAIDAMNEQGVHVPLFCTVTIETTGTMLVGTEIGAALVTLDAYKQIAGIGLNCATGPQEMSEHIRHLSQCSDRLLIVQPNAGLPQLVNGETKYPLTPKELARWLVEFVEVDGAAIVGGCCGTTPAHMAAVVDALEGRTSKERSPQLEPSVSSVYQAIPIRQENACLSIGERTNANGSRKFRELLAAEDIDGMVELAREQVSRGSHTLDVCAAYVGRDETADMCGIISRFRSDVTVPLVIDSTEVPVIEAALKLAGGKCIINSINLEDGEERAGAICKLAKRFGAALIALTIDEEGMAKTCDRKIDIVRRLYDFAVKKHGIRPHDLIFDTLTFTICTGNEDDRRLALDTLDAIEAIKSTWPEVHTLLGVSNVSFGVKPPVRRVLNSVFLHHARLRGLDSAILNASGILPLYRIDEHQRHLAEDLIFARHREGYDPLTELLATAENVDTAEPEKTSAPKSVEERLKLRIIQGERRGIDEDLDEAMLTFRPLDIVNNILLDGMKTVGDLFGAGQMQLPFVLQSAETMKAAVRHLEPFMDKADSSDKGSIVLATVRGDVHDIGKNLVDIILTNNGYRVHNLGIKQPISRIIEAAQEFDTNAIGMSGLLVKSTVVMRENLAVLNEHEITMPVILGGAALTRRYVEEDLRPEYEGPLYYAKDAFSGLRYMEDIASGRVTREVSSRSVGARRGAGAAPPDEDVLSGSPADRAGMPESYGYVAPKSDISGNEPVPQPPYWGSRVIEKIDPRAVAAYINENMLFQVQWQYRKNRRKPDEYARYINDEVRPILRNLLDQCEREGILNLKAVYGFWPAQSDGDSLIVYDSEDQSRKIARFEFPRMGKPPYWCLSDFFKSVGSDTLDVVSFMVVTAGRRVSEVAADWFAADRYQDYLHLHGLGVEMAEAFAEYLHKQIRMEWGIAGQDAREKQSLFKQHYQGSRYSFGYPACPRLDDQLKLWPVLKPDRIDVALSEEFQLEPEQTTTALIVHHRQAKYFNVR